jgi:hypothetical protein
MLSYKNGYCFGGGLLIDSIGFFFFLVAARF